MILKCIDIGNTNVVIGTYEENKLRNLERFESSIALLQKKINFDTNYRIAISSVVPKLNKFVSLHTPTSSQTELVCDVI